MKILLLLSMLITSAHASVSGNYEYSSMSQQYEVTLDTMTPDYMAGENSYLN
jgi:hypothetical protein